MVASGIIRLIAPNPGAYTFTGTCSYVIGETSVVLVDPGPEDAAHLARLIAVIGGRPIEAILLTHTHRDHSPLAAALKAETGAPVLSGGPHRPARSPRPGEEAMLDASADFDHLPDRLLRDGERLSFAAADLEVIATPGHAMNHLCFLRSDGVLFSGDHVMGWSTSIIAPPDGAMQPYKASLEKLIARGDGIALALPGHGMPVERPAAFMRALLAHRLSREASVLQRLRAGDETTAEIVRATYAGLAPELFLPARLSVLAQLEGLIEEGKAVALSDGLDGRFALPHGH